MGTSNNEHNRAAECELRSTVLHRRGGLHVGERDIDLHVANGEVSSFAVDGSLEPVLVHFVDKCDHVIFLEKKLNMKKVYIFSFNSMGNDQFSWFSKLMNDTTVRGFWPQLSAKFQFYLVFCKQKANVHRRLIAIHFKTNCFNYLLNSRN